MTILGTSEYGLLDFLNTKHLEKKVKEKIAAEQAKPHPDKRKLRRLKASIA